MAVSMAINSLKLIKELTMKPAYALSYGEFGGVIERAKKDDVVMGNYAYIEIMGEQDLLGMPWVLPPGPNVLHIIFDDVDEVIQVAEEVDGREYIAVVPMTEEQGEQIVSFVRAHEDKKAFVTHCAAGISRSGAVAQFIMEYFGGSYADYKGFNPHTMPNARIRRILRGIAHMAH
jgi:predicted protein tyrosine phosphatase